MTYWLAIGPLENWSFCFNNGNIWGFSERYKRTWQNISKDDVVICYITHPIKGIVGYCNVNSKDYTNKPFFPKETKEGKALWPLHISLSPIKLIQEKQWESRRLIIERKGVTLQQSLQKLQDERAKQFISDIEVVAHK